MSEEAVLLVLDFGQAAVGPVAAEWMGMLGATVIKVVRAPKGDFARWATPLIGGMGTKFIGNNLTRLGVVVDLKTAEGLERAKLLIANADVLIETFRSPAIMERLGLGYGVMAEVNPQLIYRAAPPPICSRFAPLGQFRDPPRSTSVHAC